MRVAIGSDHAGYDLKNAIVAAFGEVEFVDVGTHDRTSCDYPDYALAAADLVRRGEVASAILVCGTGLGMSIAANKVAGVRASCCTSSYAARLTREHNDANVLCLGSRVIGEGVAMDIVTAWLATPFSGDARHQRRIDRIAQVELEGGCA